MQCIPPPCRVPRPNEDVELPLPPELPSSCSFTSTSKFHTDGPEASTGQLAEFYLLLGVSMGSTCDDIKKAYSQEALRLHPDVIGDRKQVTLERYAKLNIAFDTLFDPARRTCYDTAKLSRNSKDMRNANESKLNGGNLDESTDDDDSVLTKVGIQYKKMSWRGYVWQYGRLGDGDDPSQIIVDDQDPRTPLIKLMIFWRWLGESAYSDVEEGFTLHEIIRKIWKSVPKKWPQNSELASMGQGAQQDWKHRRMLYKRRKEKLLLHLELHKRYLAIPFREKRERERAEAFRKSRLSQSMHLSMSAAKAANSFSAA